MGSCFDDDRSLVKEPGSSVESKVCNGSKSGVGKEEEKEALLVEDEFPDLSTFKIFRVGSLGYSSVFGDEFDVGFGAEVIESDQRGQLSCMSITEPFSPQSTSSGDIRGSEIVAVNGMLGCSGNNVESVCGEADDGRRVGRESRPVIVCRRSNPQRGATLRSNLAEGNLCQLKGTGNTRRNSSKSLDVSSSFLLCASRIPDKSRRKRSCFRRRAQPSGWGPLKNLMKIFEQNATSERLKSFDCQFKTEIGNFRIVESEHKLAEGIDALGVESPQQDGQLGEKDIQSSLTEEASIELGECPGVSSQTGPEKWKVNGEVNGELCSLSGDLPIVDQLHGSENSNNTKNMSRCKPREYDASHRNSQVRPKTTKRTTRKGSQCNNLPDEQSINDHAELTGTEESKKLPNGVLLGQYVSNSKSVAYKTKGHKLPRGEGCRRESAHGILQKSETKLSSEVRGQRADGFLDARDCMSFHSGSAKPTSTMPSQVNCERNAGTTVVAEDVRRLGITNGADELASSESNHGLEQDLPPEFAWVLCDDCEKWRRISVEQEKTLQETKCKWTCKENIDRAFADCSIPQEKTNAEIDAELGIFDEDPTSVKPYSVEVEPPILTAPQRVSQRASWAPIQSNVFLHRNRRSQTIDEVMVCHCKPPQDGHRGCGNQCLNRMLSIECAKGTCPCGNLCSNQRFQKHKYAKFKLLRCGKKGFGLQLQENVSQGQFLIEYVGEVLDLSAYDARQRYYASRGQKHFYFMTLNGGEVIDACGKGNLGRFINHSCDPNCRTEKWMVKGEVCIGLFAIRDIRKGEELTFDYNYVRVVGAAVKKCVCGSSKCRGYIGGDPLNSEVVVQSDSEEEDIEPTLICKNGERGLNADDSVSTITSISTKVVKHEVAVERDDIIVTSPPVIPKPDICGQLDIMSNPIPESTPFAVSIQPLDLMKSENTTDRPLSDIPPQGDSDIVRPIGVSIQASTTTDEVLSESDLYSKKLISKIVEEKTNTAKPCSSLKFSRSSTAVKKVRSSVKTLVSHEPNTLASPAGTGRFEGVEEKLNLLLDINGGISKQKDATKGYLKLLFVTAAEGDGVGCVSQSTRDLSLILDAILKTKSRKVLMDIINKNGLQMLHNIMKQNRRNFTRIPIIRKLLKVLEFLALTGILTIEQINKDPPCSGVESFKESILKLANHSDRQVQKIARDFCNKWIPRPGKPVEPSERGDRKRRPRWDSPSDPQSLSSIKDQMPEVASSQDSMQQDDEGPPGFGFQYKDHHSQVSFENAVISGQVAMGDKWIPHPIKRVNRGDRKRISMWDNPSDRQSLLASEDQMPEVANSKDSMQLDDEGPPGFALHYKDHNSEASSKNTVITSEEVLGDKQIPRLIKRVEPSERGDRKRRTRWDNPSESLLQMQDVASSKDSMQLDDGGPPGFGLHYKYQNSPISSDIAIITGEVVVGHMQEIFLPQLGISYGFPVTQMQQFGTPETVVNPCSSNWAIAAGIPFHPFPPLPLYPRRRPSFREQRRPYSRQQRQHVHERFRPFRPHKRLGHDFQGRERSRPPSSVVGNVKRDLRGAFCPPDGVNNSSNNNGGSGYH